MSRISSFVLTIIFLFMIGSTSGWVLELLFRRFFSSANKEKKWINPGFLVGPCLPLYGFGLIALYILSLLPFMEKATTSVGRVIVSVIVMGAVMTLIELIAGIIFISGLHVKLWDYKDRWGNYKGIICPLFSLIWGVLGSLYYFFLQPHVVRAVSWFNQNIAFSFFVGIFVGIFIIDNCYSFRIVSIIKRLAVEYEVVVKYDELKAHIRNAAEESAEKVRFLFAFKSEGNFKAHINDYIKKTKSIINDGAQTIKNIRIRGNK